METAGSTQTACFRGDRQFNLNCLFPWRQTVQLKLRVSVETASSTQTACFRGDSQFNSNCVFPWRQPFQLKLRVSVETDSSTQNACFRGDRQFNLNCLFPWRQPVQLKLRVSVETASSTQTACFHAYRQFIMDSPLFSPCPCICAVVDCSVFPNIRGMYFLMFVMCILTQFLVGSLRFFIDIILTARYGPGFESYNRNEYRGYILGVKPVGTEG